MNKQTKSTQIQIQKVQRYISALIINVEKHACWLERIQQKSENNYINLIAFISKEYTSETHID